MFWIWYFSLGALVALTLTLLALPKLRQQRPDGVLFFAALCLVVLTVIWAPLIVISGVATLVGFFADTLPERERRIAEKRPSGWAVLTIEVNPDDLRRGATLSDFARALFTENPAIDSIQFTQDDALIETYTLLDMDGENIIVDRSGTRYVADHPGLRTFDQCCVLH